MNITQHSNSTKETALSATTRRVLDRHLSAFLDGNVQGVVADYTNESILVTPEETYKGPAQIKKFFAELIAQYPKQGSTFIVDKLVIKDELGYLIWHGKTPTLDIPFATDTFIVKEGKIYQQTFAGGYQDEWLKTWQIPKGWKIFNVQCSILNVQRGLYTSFHDSGDR